MNRYNYNHGLTPWLSLAWDLGTVLLWMAAILGGGWAASIILSNMQ